MGLVNLAVGTSALDFSTIDTGDLVATITAGLAFGFTVFMSVAAIKKAYSLAKRAIKGAQSFWGMDYKKRKGGKMKEYNVIYENDKNIVTDYFNTLETIVCIAIAQFKRNFKILEIKENWFLSDEK